MRESRETDSFRTSGSSSLARVRTAGNAGLPILTRDSHAVLDTPSSGSLIAAIRAASPPRSWGRYPPGSPRPPVGLSARDRSRPRSVSRGAGAALVPNLSRVSIAAMRTSGSSLPRTSSKDGTAASPIPTSASRDHSAARAGWPRTIRRTRSGIAGAASGPIPPRARAASQRTRESGSSSAAIRSGMAAFASGPIRPRASAAMSRIGPSSISRT